MTTYPDEGGSHAFVHREASSSFCYHKLHCREMSGRLSVTHLALPRSKGLAVPLCTVHLKNEKSFNQIMTRLNSFTLWLHRWCHIDQSSIYVCISLSFKPTVQFSEWMKYFTTLSYFPTCVRTFLKNCCFQTDGFSCTKSLNLMQIWG